LRLLKH